MTVHRNRMVRTLWGGLISLPYPGLGHVLARRWSFGAWLLALMTALGIVFAIVTDRLAPTPNATKAAGLLMGGGVLVGVVAAIDSMRLLWRRDADVRPDWRHSTWFAAVVALAVSIAAGLLFPREWRTYSTPSTSMSPTLAIGDYFVADTRAFSPRRGDVVLFKKVGDPDTIYVKRIVGLSGETVQMTGGRLVIDGAAVARDPVAEVEWQDLHGARTRVPAWREHSPGAEGYVVIEIEGDHGLYDDTAPVAVPAGAYFVLGDNRDNSTDSRMTPERGGVGFVPADNIIAKAGTIFWSRDRAKIFTSVR